MMLSTNPYILRLVNRFSDVLADIVSEEDYAALFEFGNDINARAARRGLPHEEPVALIPKDLTPADFIAEGDGGA
jgi:hypothetical protein